MIPADLSRQRNRRQISGPPVLECFRKAHLKLIAGIGDNQPLAIWHLPQTLRQQRPACSRVEVPQLLVSIRMAAFVG